MTTNMYHTALSALLGIRRRLNIVIVGANDGRINDPIYNFAMNVADRTSLLLIEPNPALLPYLRNNYSSHPAHQIANCAIGKEGTLALYVIKKEWWDRFQPAYADGWPSYRAATGITSSNKSHLEKALLQQNLNPEEAIEVLDTPAKELTTVLAEHQWPLPIDVLQIDAEGCDDLVIYSSNLDRTKPRLIYYENDHIPPERLAALLIHLSEHGYKTYRMGADSLSVRGRIDPTGIALNGIMRVSSLMRKTARGDTR